MVSSNGVERLAHPFDGLAPRYDAAFTEQILGRRLRSTVWGRLAECFAPGDHVLDLGCGTGEDAVWLARRGVRVTAVDASPGMLAVARAKAGEAGVADTITFAQVDLCSAAASGFPSSVLVTAADKGGQFDGALSNFGAMNCLPDRRAFAEVLAGVMRPGGSLITVVMGPFCPWEMIWCLAHGRVDEAVRRFRSGRPARVGGSAVEVWYPSHRRFRDELSGGFTHRETAAIGVWLPPSHLSELATRWPRLFRIMDALDSRVTGTGSGIWRSDHYMSTFVRRGLQDEPR